MDISGHRRMMLPRSDAPQRWQAAPQLGFGTKRPDDRSASRVASRMSRASDPLPNYALLDQGGACGAAGPASAPRSASEGPRGARRATPRDSPDRHNSFVRRAGYVLLAVLSARGAPGRSDQPRHAGARYTADHAPGAPPRTPPYGLTAPRDDYPDVLHGRGRGCPCTPVSSGDSPRPFWLDGEHLVQSDAPRKVQRPPTTLPPDCDTPPVRRQGRLWPQGNEHR